MMKIIAFLLALFWTIPILASAQAVERASEPMFHQCSANGVGCSWRDWCDTGTNPRKCWPKRENGKQCNRGEKCLSGCCTNSKCVSCGNTNPCKSVTCKSGEYCDAGICYPMDSCYSFHCDFDEFCDSGRCWDKRPNGKQCSNNDKCLSGCCSKQTKKCESCGTDPCYNVYCKQWQYCKNGKCFDRAVDPCKNVQCKSFEYCDGGKCYLKDPCHGVQCQSHEYCSYGSCLPVDPCYGIYCKFGQYCQDGHCYETDPCRQVQCNDRQFCDNGKCRTKRSNGSQCSSDDKCQSGCCSRSRECVFCVSPNPCQGVHCNDWEYCDGGRCFAVDPCHAITCQTGWECHEGGCFQPRCQNNNDCPSGYNCGSGRVCVMDDVDCRVDKDCPSNKYCDHYGNCQPYCYHDNDCYGGEWCNENNECIYKLQNGVQCEYDYQCSSGYCSGTCMVRKRASGVDYVVSRRGFDV